MTQPLDIHIRENDTQAPGNMYKNIHNSKTVIVNTLETAQMFMHVRTDKGLVILVTQYSIIQY